MFIRFRDSVQTRLHICFIKDFINFLNDGSITLI